MKKNIITTIFLFQVCAVFAQGTINEITKKLDSTKKKPIVPDSIIKVKGTVPTFSKSTLNNTKTSDITQGSKLADDYPEASGDQPTNPLITSVLIDAGRTTGELNVSATGASTYTVPISLPPGIGSMMPKVALNYSSQGGPGIAGVGWNIVGASSISRIPTTIFHDNRIDGINFNEHDRFALDGQRLILKSGTYGGDGAEYQTENYSNVKIISRGISSFGANYGPAYFEVFYADGSKAMYGLSSNTSTQTDYAINYMENPLGLRINYSYSLSGNILVLNEINYGSVGNVAGINQILFSYNSSFKPQQHYVGGVSFYSDNLLGTIAVKGNGVTLRSYHLTHEITSLGYRKIAKIQEFNGTGDRAFEPIGFAYNLTGDIIVSTAINNLSLNNITASNSEIVTADFTGNGSMDFLLYPKINKNKFWAFYDMEPGSPYLQMGYEVNTGAFKDILPATILSWNEKILPGQGILLVKENGANSYKFDLYSSGTTAPVYYQYSKVWDNIPTAPSYYSECDNQSHDGPPLNMTFLSGDFNGDGLTDVIAINDCFSVIYERIPDPHNPYADPRDCEQTISDIGSSVYFINMDRRLNSNYVLNLGGLSQSYTLYEKLYTGDFNGDGKTDILHIKSGKMLVYTMNNNNTLELLWKSIDSRINSDGLVLLGDYNGDGKTDIMFSTGYNSYFATFISTGKSFEKQESYQPFANVAGNWDGTRGVERLQLHYLFANDINGDGKTDIISAQTTTRNNNSYGTIDVTVHHNIGPFTTANTLQFTSGTAVSNYTRLIHYPIPVFLNPNRPNYNLEFGFMSDNSISLFKMQNDFRTEAQMQNVLQDGVFHRIDYSSINGNQGNYQDIPIYEISYDQVYPYVDLHTIPGLSVVSKINRYYNSQEVNQVFSYGKAVTHAGGLGFLGFGELIRSNWHIDASDNNRLFNISISSPKLRGAILRNFSSKSYYISPSYKNLSITSLPTGGGVSDGASLSDYISRTDQVYNTELRANKVFVNVPVAMASKDLLNGTSGTQSMEYDSYYNLIKSISNFGGTATKTEESTYDNNLSGYYIGRPLSTKSSLDNGTDQFSTEEQFTYSGFLPTEIKKKGNGTGWITENLSYDTFGNITQKTTTVPGGAQRTISMQYDPTGRFSTQLTDVEGMISTAVYNVATGNKESTANAFGQIESYLYDTWGRLLTTTDYLNVNANRTYQKDGYNIVITDTDGEGHSSTVTTNPLGQIIEAKEKNILGQYVGKATQFDAYGREIAVSQPNQPGNYNQWNTTEYDEYGRVKQTSSYTGKVTNITYSGLSTTVNDGTKSVTTTKNLVGNVVTLQDPGGTIYYSYYANGNMKTANYDGIEQSIEQDGWGRKTKLKDPSAGVYQYEYDGWGQLTKEINPKGSTQYTFDPAGKLNQKKIIGDNTNIQYSYAYNGTTKLLTEMSLSNTDGNNANYTYNYDSNKRISSTVEDNLHARFVKSFTYDNFGRVYTEGYEAKDKQSNITVQKTIEMQYQNGELLKTTLQGTGQIVWQLSNLDGKGQLTEAMQGNALKNTYQYDAYGLPSQTILQNVGSSSATLMSLGYSFNAQRGVLNSRNNTAFSWNENFNYDNQNRLTNFNDNLGNNSQSYDARGRIQNNSQLGNYTYNSSNYQQTELDLSNNVVANNYYQQNHALQQVTYNVFKSPVEIWEQGKEKVSFQYNASLGRSHMYYGDEQTNMMNRHYRRHYSEDGGMEITNDMQSGKTSFVFYLAGDAYSAPAIWKEEYQSGQNTQNLYYLHRDHLGSIIMITNEQGNVVEKRAFDAWGNIVQLQDGNGNNLATFVILDRGYTGHEHLLGVGLIHMNGRLYDPKLHRFLSPDNYVQDAYNTQNFNRYGYAMNNPLMFTDKNGEFIWAFFAAGALIGALTGGISYVASAIRTGDWSWKGLGMSMLTGALIGGATGGFNPMSLISNSLGGTFLTAFAGGLMPSVNLSIGKFSFSLSPSVVFGKSFGIGANFGVSFGSKWSISAGLGFMYYGNYQGFGAQGTELRRSLMAGYDNGENGFSIGTNNWKGGGDMKDFNQRTGMLGLHFGEFSAQYENDGSIGPIGDDGDRYRSASLQVSVGQISASFSLFTGFRDYKNENGSITKHRDPLCVDDFGRRMPNGLARELNKPYRLGLLTIGYGNYRFGVDSEHIRHAIQDQAIHNLRIPWFNGKAIIDKRQMGFQNQSWQWLGFGQYKTRNSFTTW